MSSRSSHSRRVRTAVRGGVLQQAADVTPCGGVRLHVQGELVVGDVGHAARTAATGYAVRVASAGAVVESASAGVISQPIWVWVHAAEVQVRAVVCAIDRLHALEALPSVVAVGVDPKVAPL